MVPFLAFAALNILLAIVRHTATTTPSLHTLVSCHFEEVVSGDLERVLLQAVPNIQHSFEKKNILAFSVSFLFSC